MKKVSFVKNVKNGEELFSNIKCKSIESLLNRIDKKLNARYVGTNHHGHYVFKTPTRYGSYDVFEIRIVMA